MFLNALFMKQNIFDFHEIIFIWICKLAKKLIKDSFLTYIIIKFFILIINVIL